MRSRTTSVGPAPAAMALIQVGVGSVLGAGRIVVVFSGFLVTDLGVLVLHFGVLVFRRAVAIIVVEVGAAIVTAPVTRLDAVVPGRSVQVLPESARRRRRTAARKDGNGQRCDREPSDAIHGVLRRWKNRA